MWLRKDWMERLGLSDPVTLEEGMEIIRQFGRKKTDMAGNQETRWGFLGKCGAIFGYWWAPNNPLSLSYSADRTAKWQPYLLTGNAAIGHTYISIPRRPSVWW